MIGIGIDTGGTCTDAVIYDFESQKVLASSKAMTTKSNLEIGIGKALDALPADLTAQAESVSLSTTLATNACLEGKGARARLLLIGFPPENMPKLTASFASYGMKDAASFHILDAKPEGIFSQPYDPDWEDLQAHAKETFSGCESVGIVQVFPKANGGRFELKALSILRQELDVPLTISYEISNETDFLKNCAGTLVNAMLIPLITDFMDSIRHVLLSRGLSLPVSILLSNGTRMPDASARLRPVETILCGPAASVIGGSVLAGEKNAIIVDMGGTTTDISVIHDMVPLEAQNGIRIGIWKTMVRGIYVETVGLGGDSAIYCKDHEVCLDTVRAIPISVLAAQYPQVLPYLEDLAVRKDDWSSVDMEFYVLIKDVKGREGYTDREKAVCSLLEGGPVAISRLEEEMNTFRQFLGLDRLEMEGVILKSALTPTDMMILKRDFTLYDGTAARIAAKKMARSARCRLEDLIHQVYDLVYRRMYCALGKLLLSQQFPKTPQFKDKAYLEAYLGACFSQAKQELDEPETYGTFECRLNLSTTLPLVGVGAPIHIFLPRVAALLHTRCIIPPYAQVANALGAVASRKIARVELTIDAIYDNTNTLIGFAFPDEGSRCFYETYEEATRKGKEAILRTIQKKALLYEMEGEPKITLEMKDNRIGHVEDGLLLAIHLQASAAE